MRSFIARLGPCVASKHVWCLVLVAVSVFKVDIVYTGEPAWLLWGNPQNISYDPVSHTWINRNPAYENIFREMSRSKGYEHITQPERVPEKKKAEIKVNLFWRRENPMAQVQAMMACALAAPNRRLRLINAEYALNELARERLEYRLWPHLGILFVGTVADEEGWDVSLHDELVQGYVTPEKFVQPGDVVGVSLVGSSMERGIELARQAKRLGASYVIAGNDSAIFRADQLLRLPDRPFDAVFTTNGLSPFRQFLRRVGSGELSGMDIPGMAVIPTGISRSNEPQVLRAERDLRLQLRKRGRFNPQDVFVVPKLSLYGEEYWQAVWKNYRAVFGHKHKSPATVRNATALFAQGCTRTGTADACSYCTIADVADIRLPAREYLGRLLETYQSFGINYVFNTTDSVLEMHRVAADLKSLGAFFPEGLMIYGRAWGLAHHPELIDEWLSLTGGRLLVNVGMDSGDERILQSGVSKSSQSGLRFDENRRAVLNLAASGAHLHFSLIFGSPGETLETCEKSLEFFEWARSVLGAQLDQCEPDIYWLNHGSPASRVFRDYSYAQELASLAGRTISRETWEQCFHRHRDTLMVPWECQVAWYECFTSISVEDAQKCNEYIAGVMSGHTGAAPARAGLCRAFRPV
jgi:radical SAM superfamily enzyme YgiQ (UPF0313 family)